MPDDPKDLDHLKPIDHAVIARPHTPVYKMHRYFARRPWSVFAELIQHYSNPGSIILDPFCGGGVTAYEGLRLGRRVVGVDINPLATFVTRCELTPGNVDELQVAFQGIESETRDRIAALYLTTCPRCRGQVPADWFEYSSAYGCSRCGATNVLSQCKKLRAGTYQCVGCKEKLKPSTAMLKPPVMINVFLDCQKCRHKGIKEPDASDVDRFREAERLLASDQFGVAQFIPGDPIPDGNMVRENAIYARGIRHFSDFFTKRNLLGNAILKSAVAKSTNPHVWQAFSASLRFTNNFVFRNPGWQGGNPIEWTGIGFWVPDVFIEQAVWKSFAGRVRTTMSGVRQAAIDLCSHPAPARVFSDLSNDSSYLILTRSSDDLPLPDNSVDAIVTDPPYGGNEQYLELSAFWIVWLKEYLGAEARMDYEREAIETRHSGFAMAKDHSHYTEMLHRIFAECHRVLKPNRWMVMTFHNRDFAVWNSVHLAAHDAGFVLAEHDGMIHQPAVRNYQQTIKLRRSGSMLGDFVLSFQKRRKPPRFRSIDYVEMGMQIERLAAEAILHHSGATVSTIYMKLMPWLLNNNLLETVPEQEVVPYLARNFEERDGKWHLRQNPEPALHEYLRQYSKTHYKAELEELNIVPVEARLDFLIRRLLYEKGSATPDEILNEVYTNLINSNAAEYGEINRVLTRLAELVTPRKRGATGTGKPGRKVWRLKEDMKRETLFKEMYSGDEQARETKEESDHDLAISRLVELAEKRGLKSHIGKTEQTKYTYFRRLTSDLPQRVAGMPKAARDIVEQIDVLWHNGGRGLVAAFEVERTTTITSGIERFRNLLAAAPEINVALYLVVPRCRERELRNTLGSPANRADGLHRKIAFIFLEDLKITSKDAGAVDFDGIIHRLEETAHVEGGAGA